ncbi:hypothetical protein FALBO_5651 [Fusarium albosuccineum]|uniref:Uncharacterized protein n=1 Tax=Fusarium albosuccineum TaxID=1237068 RepID=A0A8H4PCH4_9HYPO|nr:hypothetical protein FALBO_5651 [Fusarium albosuccineum]KAF4991402.1 hypothetical protein FDECE_14057 [Fusarium decemcellulare]
MQLSSVLSVISLAALVAGRGQMLICNQEGCGGDCTVLTNNGPSGCAFYQGLGEIYSVQVLEEDGNCQYELWGDNKCTVNREWNVGRNGDAGKCVSNRNGYLAYTYACH